MMLGLESWIPMYMTGQISPYYLRSPQSGAFNHFLRVSGAAALSGEAIAGYHSDGRYYLSKTKEDIAYYRRRADDLLKNATPLMEIYRGGTRGRAERLSAHRPEAERTQAQHSLCTADIHHVSRYARAHTAQKFGIRRGTCKDTRICRIAAQAFRAVTCRRHDRG